MSRSIIIALNVYQEQLLLPECLESVVKNAPKNYKIVAVDGAYQAFMTQSKVLGAQALAQGKEAEADLYFQYTYPASQDETVNILKDFGVDEIVLAPKEGWENEHVKRSEYFRQGKDGDYFFVLDADERVVGKIPEPEELDEHYDWCINLKRDDGINAYPIMRIHRFRDTMRYEGAHHALFANGQLIKRDDCQKAGALLQNCSLYHRWEHRGNTNPIRHKCKGAYYRQLSMSEERFRALNGI